MIPPLSDFIDNVKQRAPDGDEPTIFALAHVERLLAHYGELLETDVGDAVAAKWFKDLSGDAIRLRAALGIGKGKPTDDTPPLAPVRRP